MKKRSITQKTKPKGTQKGKTESRGSKATPTKQPKSSKKSKKQPGSNSAKKKISQVSSGKKVVCKRGYKLCKNPMCGKMINIHTKVCPHCGFINRMKNSKKSLGNLKEVLEKDLDLSKKKLSTKGQLSKIKDQRLLRKRNLNMVHTSEEVSGGFGGVDGAGNDRVLKKLKIVENGHFDGGKDGEGARGCRVFVNDELRGSVGSIGVDESVGRGSGVGHFDLDERTKLVLKRYKRAINCVSVVFVSPPKPKKPPEPEKVEVEEESEEEPKIQIPIKIVSKRLKKKSLLLAANAKKSQKSQKNSKKSKNDKKFKKPEKDPESHPETSPELSKGHFFVLVGGNNLKKIKNFPRTNKLIQYNLETQEVFELTHLQCVGEKFEGTSFLEILGFGVDSANLGSTLESVYRVKTTADILKIKVYDVPAGQNRSERVVGLISSGGHFELIWLDFGALKESGGGEGALMGSEVAPSRRISLKKGDEIFTCFDFVSDTRLLIGTQKGTILLCKVLDDRIKVINSFNRYQNFMITNISVMPIVASKGKKRDKPGSERSENTPGSELGAAPSPESQNQAPLFAYSTADGFVKIQSIDDDFPIFHYQSISKTIRSLHWDYSTRALIYSDENEKYFLSFCYFNPTNIDNIISKKITKTSFFVEAVSQVEGLNQTAIVDRKGNLCFFNSSKCRLYFYKHKEKLELKVALSARFGDHSSTKDQEYHVRVPEEDKTINRFVRPKNEGKEAKKTQNEAKGDIGDKNDQTDTTEHYEGLSESAIHDNESQVSVGAQSEMSGVANTSAAVNGGGGDAENGWSFKVDSSSFFCLDTVKISKSACICVMGNAGGMLNILLKRFNEDE